MGGAGASGMLTFQVTNAADIYQLEGLSTQTGGSIGVGPSAGLEGIIGNGYTGANLSLGFNVGPTPVELHSVAEYAWVQGWNSSNVASTASGGFVLYPNKPNTNMMQQVYAK